MRVGPRVTSVYVLVLGLNNWRAHHRNNRFHMKCGKYTRRYWPITETVSLTMSKQSPPPFRLKSQMFLEIQHNYGYRSKWSPLKPFVSIGFTLCIFDAHTYVSDFIFVLRDWVTFEKSFSQFLLGNGREIPDFQFHAFDCAILGIHEKFNAPSETHIKFFLYK